MSTRLFPDCANNVTRLHSVKRPWNTEYIARNQVLHWSYVNPKCQKNVRVLRPVLRWTSGVDLKNMEFYEAGQWRSHPAGTKFYGLAFAINLGAISCL
jgi:hypothetical protein